MNAAATSSVRSRAASITGLRLVIVAIALVPIATLGVPSVIPLEPRVFASILWVLCLVPAWHYLQLPERRRPPIPFLPLIGAVYLFYYPLHVVLGQSSVNYLFHLDPAFDYDRPVQYALAGWVALSLRDDWSDQHKRSFIANAAQLYRLRGTKAGVLQFLKIYVGDNNTRIDLSELTDRFQIGVHSRVGVDTILDGGSPFFFRVKAVLGIQDLQKQMDILNSLIDLQKPAHTHFELTPITVRFQIGMTSRIGVDTLLGVPEK